MLAREIMIPEPLVVAAGATSAEVALLMQAKDISVVPVVDNPKDRRYLGTISDRDIVTQCVAAGHDPTDCQALEHARTDTIVVSPDTELGGFRIEQLDEKDTHIRSTIVVINEDKRVVGFIPHPEFIQGIVIVRGADG
jgi:CBS domain-containing protein